MQPAVSSSRTGSPALVASSPWARFLPAAVWVLGTDIAGQWFGEGHKVPRMAAVDVTRLETPRLREAARTALTQSGYRPLFEHSQVELWTLERAD